MNEQALTPSDKRHRFPLAIIAHAVWLSFRFALSYRDVEELLAERGVVLTYETVRQWCRKFGQGYAKTLRQRRPQPGDKWPLDGLIAIPLGWYCQVKSGWRDCRGTRACRRRVASLVRPSPGSR